MAYVISNNNTSAASKTTESISISSAELNDLVVLMVSVDGGPKYPTSIVGNNGNTWTMLTNSYNTDSIAVYYSVQGATPDTSVAVTLASASFFFSVVTVIRGADTTTPIDASSFTSVSTAVPLAPSITTTADNTLLLILATGGAGEGVLPPAGFRILGAFEDSFRNAAMMAATYSVTAGSTTAYPFSTHSPSARNRLTGAIAIRDDGTGIISGYSDQALPPFEYIHMLAEGNDGNSVTNYDPTDVLNENITTVSHGSYTNSNVFNFPGPTNTKNDAVELGYITTALRTDGTISLSPQPLAITGFKFPTNKNLSSSILILLNQLQSTSFTPLTAISSCFGLSDGAGVRWWQAGATNAQPSTTGRMFPHLIEVDNSTYKMHETGTFNSSSVQSVILGSEPTATFQEMYTAPILKMGTYQIQGGHSSLPADYNSVAVLAEKAMLYTVFTQQLLAQTQFFFAHNLNIGGSQSVYWDSRNQAVEFPSAWSENQRKINFKISAGSLTMKVQPITGSTVILDSSLINMGGYHNFVLDSDVAISANGLSVLNANVILTSNAGSALSGVTFSGCKELSSSIDLSGGNTISNCVDPQSITVTSEPEFAKLHNCTFSGNTVAIKITGNQAGSWSDPNLTVSGNTYDIEYTGATNFSIQSAAALTVNNAGAGVLTIVTPTFDLTVNSSQSASQINVFATGTQTVIDSEASASSLTYTHAGETVDITVLKDGYIPFRQTGVALSGSITIDVQLVKSREYLSSHGLTYTTDASWDRAVNQLIVPTWGVTGQQVFSLIMEAFKSQTSLRNTDFNLQMDGANSLYLVNDAEGDTDTSIQNLIDCGVSYINTAGTTTATWSGVKSVGTATGFLGEYQQVDGSGTTDARATGNFNQVIKVYGDASHGNFDYTGHLVLKYQPNGYRETRVDVLDSYGISALSPTLYIVAMQPVAIAAATGDPALTLTITDHGASPVTWNSKSWSITVTADAADSGENILRELNYNLSLDATYNGKDPFNWPEMVIEAGTAYETKRGITEGGTGATLKGVRVIDGSGNPHPDFTRFQADDGTYYVVPVTANITISNLPDDVGGDTRLQIYNITTATLIYSGDPAGTSYSDSYTDGDVAYASAGDSVRIRFAHANAGTSFEYGQTIVTATSDGITANGDNFISTDSVYATNAIDGSTITKFSYTPVNDQFNLIINSNFTAAEMYAFYCYTLTTADGIEGAYGAFVASDAGNYKNVTAITSIYLDNETTASKRQTDTARIYRDDGAYPVLEPTTSGFGIDINWQNVVYVVTAGSGLTAGQAAELTAAAEAAAVNTKIGTPAVSVSADVAAIPTATLNATVEGTETLKDQIRLMRAESAGKVSVSGNTVTFRDVADTKARITATVDDNGQRTTVTTDAS